MIARIALAALLSAATLALVVLVALALVVRLPLALWDVLYPLDLGDRR